MDWHTHPLPSSLCIHPSRIGEGERKFSLDVVQALARARSLLRAPHPSPATARQVYDMLLPCLALPMASRQKLLLEYLLAWAAERDGDLRAALIHLDAAMIPAELLRDLPAYCELAWRAGVVSRQLGFLPDMHYYLTQALTTSQALAQRGYACDSQLLFDLHLRLASVHFELALFPAASRHLEAALALLPSLGPRAHLQAASLSWIQAQSLWWRGQLGLALESAVHAADELALTASPGASARIQLVVGEIALDLAERSPRGPGAPIAMLHASPMALVTGNVSYLGLASSYLQSAEQLAQEAEDPIGGMMARLAWQRWRRLGRRGEGDKGDMTILESVAHEAERIGDLAVVGRAYTALGDELRERGQREAALSSYVRARDILDRQKYHAMAIWPRRALLTAMEMSSDIPDMQAEPEL